MTRHVLASQPQTLVGFLKSIGGLRDCSELRARDARRVWPGLVNNKRGLSLDYAREAAAESGFLGEPIADAMSNSTVSEFLEALDSHPHYRTRDVDRLAAWQDQGAGQAFVDAINNEIAAVEAFAARTGFANPDDHEWMAAAAQIAIDDPSLEYGDALERAALAIYRAESERPALETAAAEIIETPALALEPIALPVFPHIAARAWRESQGLSRAKLARWIGFSSSQIQDYEEGARRGKKKAEEAVISDAAWLRYGLACAALSAGLKLPF